MYVQAIGEDYVYLNFEGNEGDLWESTPEELQGIPITEEILIKNGFEYVTEYTYELRLPNQIAGHDIIGIIVDSGFVSIAHESKSLIMSRCTCSGVHFVHELQNLFWNITKQQLTINL
jgi:hypothetical protein